MTEKNGTAPPTGPPTGERGISVGGNLARGGLATQYGALKWGIEDYTRPTALDVEKMVARDGIAQALYYLLTFLVGDAPVHIEGEGPKADHVRDNLLGNQSENGMTTPMTTVLKQMASGIAFKRAPFEKVWDYHDNKVWLKKLKFLPVTTCKILPDKTGGYNGFVQHTANTILSGQTPPKFGPEKSFVYFHDGAMASLEGRSALTAAWHEHEHKNKTRDRLHIHLSLHALGVKVGTTKGGDEAASDLLERIHSVEGGGSVILDGTNEEELALLTAGSTQEFTPYLSFVNREMATSTLMQWLGLGGSEGSGAHSLSRDHSSFTVSQADGTLRQMGEDLTRYVVSDLIRYNFGPNSSGVGDDPKIVLGPISENAKKLAVEMFMSVITAPASQLTDNEMRQLKEKAFQAVDIEVDDEDSQGIPESSGSSDSRGTRSSKAGLAKDDPLEQARKIMRGES